MMPSASRADGERDEDGDDDPSRAPRPPAWCDALTDASVTSWPAGAPLSDPEAQVWFVPDFLDADDASVVAKGCAKLRKKLKGDHSFAVGRLSAMVPMASAAYGTFAGDAVLARLRSLTGVATLKCGDYPVEARLYRPGSSMGWHQDVKLYETPQHELIYTVSNESDACTQWRGSDGVVYAVTPPANSALLFRADAAWHRVVPAGTGERVIVKALYASEFTKTEAYAELMAEAPW